jgi:hypothetical protein
VCTSAIASYWSSSIKKACVPARTSALEARNYDGTVSLSVDKPKIRLGVPAAEKIRVVKP